MKIALLLIALLGLAGCGAPMNSPEACAFTLKAEVPVTFSGGVPIAVAKVNGTTARMIFDTGAGLTVLTKDGAEHVSAARDSTMHSVVRGVGGAAPSVVATLGSVELSGLRKSAVQAFILTETNFQGKVDGLLGSDFLSDYDLDIDLAHARISLYAPRNCTRVGPNWPEPATALPRLPTGGLNRRACSRPCSTAGRWQPRSTPAPPALWSTPRQRRSWVLRQL